MDVTYILKHPEVVEAIFDGKVSELDPELLAEALDVVPVEGESIRETAQYKAFIDFYRRVEHQKLNELPHSLSTYQHLMWLNPQPDEIELPQNSTRQASTSVASTPSNVTENDSFITLKCKGSDPTVIAHTIEQFNQQAEERSKRSFFTMLGLSDFYQSTPFSIPIPGDDDYDSQSLCPPKKTTPSE